MGKLVVSLDGVVIKEVQITKDKTTLGRRPYNDIVIDNLAVSGEHVAFHMNERGVEAEDLGSTNGTRLNGQPLQTKQILKPGDKITASHITLLYREAEQPKNRTVFFDASRMEAHPSTVAIHLSDLLDSQTSERLSPEPASGSAWVTPLQALLRVGRELVQGRPLEELFGVILNLALEGVGAERGVLMAHEGEELVEKASRGGEFRISTVDTA